jgi:moderate conductance mechanosensitive channel
MLNTSVLRDVVDWARGSGLEIVLLITGAILLTRLATWLREKITRRIDARAQQKGFTGAVGGVETQARAGSGVHMGRARHHLLRDRGGGRRPRRSPDHEPGRSGRGRRRGARIRCSAHRPGHPRGFFIIAERQYGFGDLVRLTAPNVAQPAVGTVEDVTLRVTSIRTADGELVITPNGQITQVTNLSRDWARAVVDVPVPAAMDVGTAR